MSSSVRAFGLVLLLGSGLARAASLPVSLFWQAPLPCPQYAEVWTRLTDRLGREPETPPGSSFTARAVAEPVDEGWKLELQTLTESGAGHRVLTGATCEDVTKQAVVILALAIDPLLPPPPEVPRRPVWLSLGASTSFGRLLQPTAGVRLGGRFEVGLFAGEFAVGTSPLEQRKALEGGGLTLSSPLDLSLAGCVGWQRDRVRLGGCLTVEGGVLVATGEFDPPVTAAVPWLEAGGKLEGRVSLSERWALRLVGGASASLLRPAFVLIDGSIAWQLRPVVASGALLVEFRVW
ncbi:MAG: hypothetical protein ACOZQL_04175 [Myxococcota bacterium]